MHTGLLMYGQPGADPVLIEFPEFVTMQRMYGARDFEFVSISTDGIKKKEKVLEFLKSKGAATKNYLYSGEDKYQLIEYSE